MHRRNLNQADCPVFILTRQSSLVPWQPNRYRRVVFLISQMRVLETVPAWFHINCICSRRGQNGILPTMKTSIQNGREPVYQKLADLLEGMIRDRSLRSGDRMPSVRRFG